VGFAQHANGGPGRFSFQARAAKSGGGVTKKRRTYQPRVFDGKNQNARRKEAFVNCGPLLFFKPAHD
jgi:hypothetical protein